MVLNSFRNGKLGGCSREEHLDAPAAPENRRGGTVARGHAGFGGGKQANRTVGATVEEPLHAGRHSSEFTGHVQRAFVVCVLRDLGVEERAALDLRAVVVIEPQERAGRILRAGGRGC